MNLFETILFFLSKACRPVLGLALLFLAASPLAAQDCNCNPQILAGSDTPVTAIYDLGVTTGTFVFFYQTYTQPDEILVISNGVTLFDTGCVGATASVTLSLNGSNLIDIQVIPNCAGGTGTAWEYGLNWCSISTAPTCTPTPSPTLTSTFTPTWTYSPTPTPTFQFSPTNTSTSTPTLTPTHTPTTTPTFTPTVTATITPTYTPTLTATLTPSSTPTCVPQVWPDPFDPRYAVDKVMKIGCLEPGSQAEIYTLSGEKVISITQSAYQYGSPFTAVWDGKNDKGVPVSPGIYFYVVRKGDQVAARGKFLVAGGR